jgi:hypothetical protein
VLGGRERRFPRSFQHWQHALVACQRGFERVAQVDEHMVAISDLPGARNAACGCFRIPPPRAITADDLHAPMCTRPSDDGVGFPVRQHLDRTMGLQIDQQRAIAIAFFPGEIVQAQHLRGLTWGHSRAANEPQKRITARGHREALRQLRTCFASVSKGDLHQGLGLSERPSGVGVR